MKNLSVILIILCAAVAGLAQEKPAAIQSVAASKAVAETKKPEPPPVTADEEIAIRNAQLSMAEAQRALESSKEWQAYTAAQGTLGALLRQVYTSRSIDVKEYLLCDGNKSPLCADVTPGRLALRRASEPEKSEGVAKK